jgi:transposase
VKAIGRAIGLDVHLDFCEIAICEDGKVRSAGRVASTPEALKVLAESLLPTDRVALEVTGSSWEILRILEPHVERVIVVSPDDTGIRQARAKTDRLDSRTLAKLLWGGELDGVWTPDELTRVLRRRLGRREQLVRSRSRAKNEVHAVLMRRLKGRPPVSDLFGVKGRQWLRQLELPVEECETVEGCMRHVEFLDAEIAEVERLIARQMLSCSDARRLMSVPGVNVICAASFWRRSATSAGSRPRGSWPRISALTRRSASPAASPRVAGGSPSRARRRRAGRWSRRRSASSASPARCTRSTSGCVLAAVIRSRSSPPRASSRACSGAYSPARSNMPTSSHR